MQMNRYRLHNGKLPLSSIFLAGVLAGIITMNLGKSILLENTGLLDEQTLYHMKYMTVDSSAFFYYILQLRFKSILGIVILATTYLGLFVCGGAVFGYGFSAGAFLSALLVRYGMKGIVFAVLSLFPQCVLYIPAFVSLIIWCERLNRSIYFKTEFVTEKENMVAPVRRVLQLIGILAVLLLGCIAEGFMNPKIMKWLLGYF